MADFNMDEMIEKIKSGAVKVSKEAGRITKNAASRVETMTTDAKLKYAIRELEEKMQENFRQIGEAVYNSFKNGDEPEDFFEAFGRLDAIEEEIGELRERISVAGAAQTGICPCCGRSTSVDDLFCSKCGAVLKDDE